ncbi:unnamed protein product [Clonostachys rhizophaga]|uniref:Uncharacterized protein n=1 Tax=Clonostachys rhizophaga TaxID=160324 RepID=A0A9N9VA65_9HYPO|nr:unnamed protein product [Clonostachys rhizophaga]
MFAPRVKGLDPYHFFPCKPQQTLPKINDVLRDTVWSDATLEESRLQRQTQFHTPYSLNGLVQSNECSPVRFDKEDGVLALELPSCDEPNFREHSLYQDATIGSDDLYHCPWESQADCNHVPTNTKCTYNRIVVNSTPVERLNLHLLQFYFVMKKRPMRCMDMARTRTCALTKAAVAQFPGTDLLAAGTCETMFVAYTKKTTNLGNIPEHTLEKDTNVELEINMDSLKSARLRPKPGLWLKEIHRLNVLVGITTESRSKKSFNNSARLTKRNDQIC